MEQINLNKIIIKMAIITVIILFLLFGITLSVFTFFYPAKLGQITSSLGLNNISVFYYNRAYEKSGDINDLYRLLNQSVIAKNNEKIIESFESLYNEPTYENFILYINDYYLSTTTNVMLKTHLVNEDARLKNHYIKALTSLNQNDKAMLFMIDDIQNTEFNTINDYNKLTFLANSYVYELMQQNVATQEYEIFISFILEDEEINYLQNAMNLYNEIKLVYDFELIVREENANSFELIVICEHLLNMANTILYVDEILNSSIDTTVLQSHISDYNIQFELLKSELEMLQND